MTEQDVYNGANGFPAYDATAYGFATNGFLQQQQQQQSEQQQHPPQPTPGAPLLDQTHSPTNPNHRHSVTSITPIEQTNGIPGGALNGDIDGQDGQNGSRSGSEEKEILTPQQHRRKAQNRAAYVSESGLSSGVANSGGRQRAFRERKERHVKELETKLNSLSAQSSSLASDNKRLKKELQRLATQNEILRATNAQSNQVPRSPSPVPGPHYYSPTDFATAVGVDLHGRPVSYESFSSDEGQKLLAAGAAWDLIQSHKLTRRGMVDVTEVCRRLRNKAACDGRGPAFKEAEVILAVEESALSGSDELI